MSDIDELADRIYELYNPEARGKSPTVTRAAAEYVAYMIEGRSNEITQQTLAEKHGCAPGSLGIRKDQLVEEIDISKVKRVQ